MTYKEYISQFELLNNPPKKKGLHRHHIVPRSVQTEKDETCVYLRPSQHLWAHILYDQENGTNTADFLLGISQAGKRNITSYEDCLFYDQVDKNYRASQSEKMKGEGNPMYGQTHSDEVREALRRYRTGTHMSEETKRLIGEHNPWKGTTGPMYGKRHTDQTRKLLSEHNPWKGKKRPAHAELMTGEGNPMYGKTHSAEAKKKISEFAYGIHWWTNGAECKRARECPGEGWIPGRVKKAI